MNIEKLDKFSIEEIREELDARKDAKDRAAGLEKSSTRSSTKAPLDELKDVSSFAIAHTLRQMQKVIYGDDDRMDIYHVNDPAILKNANGVAAIFKIQDITANGQGVVSLPTKTFKQRYIERAKPLCPNEPFITQPGGAIGTAFLIEPDIMVTAGHCIDESNIDFRRFVFGYRMQDYNTIPNTVPAENVYMGVDLLGWHLDSQGADWAVVRLDRNVEGIEPLTIRQSGEIADNTPLYVLGHPVGLPLKYGGNAEVRNNTHQAYFRANLDTFAGNSGSPVFNLNTHEVEGILVRGETDFAPKDDCYVSMLCPVQGCRGEDCTRITIIQSVFSA